MVTLSEYEELGIKLIVLARHGILSAFDCATCSDEMKESLNCDVTVNEDVSVFYHKTVGELGACPVRFISQAILDMIDKMDYLEKYPATAEKHKDCNPRLWASIKFYDSFNAEITKSDDNKTTDTQTNKDKMASLFKK